MQSPEPQDTRGNGSFGQTDLQHDDPESHHVPVNYAPNTGKFLAIGAAILGLALAVGFYLMHHHRNEEFDSLEKATALAAKTPPVVDVVSVKPSPTTQPLSLPGETQAWDVSTIYAQVSGYIGTWKHDIGDKVNKGDVLATIETPQLDAQLTAAEAKLNVSQAQVAVEQANADFAESTYKRWEGSPAGSVSPQEVESKKADYNSSIAKVKAAKAQVSLNQADVDSLKAQTGFKQVTAPFDGVITHRNIDFGDLVTAGSTSNTKSLYTIAQSNTIRAFVDVPQGASSDMIVGMPAAATTSEFPGRKFQGKLTRTAKAIDPVSRTLHVEVDIPNEDLTLVPGMYVEVSFELAKRALLEVRASAMLFRSTGEQVAVVGRDGKVSFHKVTIAQDEGDFVEIGSGLSPGDRVALNISSEIEDGEVVTANDVDEPAPAAVPSPKPTTGVSSADSGR